VTAVVLRGDARNLPLPDGCVDLVVTSPPYFGLRDYGYDGQIGSEGTPGEWLEALWACTAEWVRVLKPEGSLFVNLGDKYSTGNSGDRNTDLNERWNRPIGKRAQEHSQIRTGRVAGMPPKSLLGLPWRYAIGCMDRLGLILRAEIVWAKPNGLPESVTDRVRRAHEQVFHFTRQPRYYAAVDEIRESYAPGTAKRYAAGYNDRAIDGQRLGIGVKLGGDTYGENPLGKLPGSVWEIPSAPLQVPARLGVDHFAAFPPALVRPLVLGWSPPGVCTACGQGMRPVSERGPDVLRRPTRHAAWAPNGGKSYGESGRLDIVPDYRITGYACACGIYPSQGGVANATRNKISPSPAASDNSTTATPRTSHSTSHNTPPMLRPAVVLDPFGGTGTTALVASAYGRIGITVDLSAGYCRLAAWRVRDPGERARARAMPKPPPVPDGMEPLFTM
jgi:DNA modification methylase